MNRPNPQTLMHNRYVDLPGVEVFDRTMLLDVEQMARNMTDEEVIASFGLQLSDLNDAEAAVFATACRRGRAKGLAQAGDRLFNAMSDRGGGQLSLEYLRMFGDRYPADAGENLNTPQQPTLKLIME